MYIAKFLVVASGENSEGYIPQVKGLNSFKGEFLHSCMYVNGKKYDGKNVLVVGSGNSGMEIPYDLSNWGASTSIVVRSPVVPSMTKLRGNKIKFENGYSNHYDAIVFATGYKSTVLNWLKDGDQLFNDKGMPKQNFPNHWKAEKGLYCAGFSRSGLFGISNDAGNIAET